MFTLNCYKPCGTFSEDQIQIKFSGQRSSSNVAVVLLISNDSVCQNVNSVSKHGKHVGLKEYR